MFLIFVKLILCAFFNVWLFIMNDIVPVMNRWIIGKE